jgi:plastocyanin
MHELDRRLVAILAAGLLGIAGCGGDDDDGGGGSASGGSATENGGGAYGGGSGGGGGAADSAGGQRLELSADPGGALKFDKSSLTAKAGKVTIVMDNPSSLPHAVEIEGNGVEVEGETVEKGGVSKVSADLEPGQYEYYCPVGGHEAGGMKGTLSVQ